MKPIEFIALIGSSAQATAKRTGVFASITIAQAALAEAQLAQPGLDPRCRQLHLLQPDARATRRSILEAEDHAGAGHHELVGKVTTDPEEDA